MRRLGRSARNFKEQSLATESKGGKWRGMGGCLPQGGTRDLLGGSNDTPVAQVDDGGTGTTRMTANEREHSESEGEGRNWGHVLSCGHRGEAHHGKGHGGAPTSAEEHARDSGEQRWFFPGVRAVRGWGRSSADVRMRVEKNEWGSGRFKWTRVEWLWV